jgi:hypothetical protein
MQGLMGLLAVVLGNERVEARLLLEDIGCGRLRRLRFNVKCIRSWRPFCWG